MLLDIPPPYALHWHRGRQLRQRFPQLPLLLLTTDATALAGLPGNEGQVPILTKPFALETLLSAITQIVPRTPS